LVIRHEIVEDFGNLFFLFLVFGEELKWAIYDTTVVEGGDEEVLGVLFGFLEPGAHMLLS
jgi:hypothetical protein